MRSTLLAGLGVSSLHAIKPPNISQFRDICCRQSEATAHLGAVLTGYDLLAMYVVRKLGLSLGKLDDVTSETKSVEQVKAEVNVFGSQANPQTVTQ